MFPEVLSHAKLKVQDTRKRIYKETQYFSVITTCKGYQVIRVAQVRCESRKGEPMQFYCHEVVQRWISPDGKVRSHSAWLTSRVDSFTFTASAA